MKRLVARFGARILEVEALGIVIDDVDAADALPMTAQTIPPPPTKAPKTVDVVVVAGRINDRRFLAANPGSKQ